VDDVGIIDLELILADAATVDKALDRARRAAKGQDKVEKARVLVLEKIAAALSEGIPVRALNLDEQEHDLVRESHLLTIKPVLYIANVAEDDLNGESPLVDALRAHAEEQDSKVLVLCGAIEAELSELEEDDQLEMLEGLGIAEPALNALARATYKLLGLQSFFTAGVIEIRAWTIPQEATAPMAAGAIHTDFEKRFIRAEVYTLNDLETYENEAGIKAAGKLRLEGRDYVVVDGDIMHIRHNA
jgi:GTP-binding protein YchF